MSRVSAQGVQQDFWTGSLEGDIELLHGFLVTGWDLKDARQRPVELTLGNFGMVCLGKAKGVTETMGRRFVNEMKRIAANDQLFVIGAEDGEGGNDGESTDGEGQPGDDLGNS
jgi:hypothetical protein